MQKRCASSGRCAGSRESTFTAPRRPTASGAWEGPSAHWTSSLRLRRTFPPSNARNWRSSKQARAGTLVNTRWHSSASKMHRGPHRPVSVSIVSVPTSSPNSGGRRRRRRSAIRCQSQRWTKSSTKILTSGLTTSPNREVRESKAPMLNRESPFSSCDEPLSTCVDGVLFDLDGVVYRGKRAVEHAVEEINALQVPHGYVTNNAGRPPSDVAAHLTEPGINATGEEIPTSAQAAAGLVESTYGTEIKVLAVGGEGLRTALTERGLTLVSSADDSPDVVVQGTSSTLTWADLAEGVYAINRGADYIATNLDPTMPTEQIARAPGRSRARRPE